nr:NADH dehydrogenase subunit 6 [Bruchus sp. EMHAU-15071302]
MMTSLLLMMWTLSIMFMFMNHPLSLGMILLLQTTFVSLVTGTMNYNFWFSYILFLIMIGGMLILFIYMTSIASNEKFKFSSKLMMFFIINMMLLIFFMIIDQYFFNFNMSTYDFIQFNDLKMNNFSLSKYFNYPNNMILYMMIIYLLLTLIMVVKITNIQYGPLRQKN